MDDYLNAIRAIWTMQQPHHRGEFVSFHGVDAYPRPVQRPSPPIVTGGTSPPALRRAVTLSDGWYGFGLDLALSRRCIDALRQTAARYERPTELGELQISVTPVGGLDPDLVEQYGQLGVDRLVVLPKPNAAVHERHAPVPREYILRNIDLLNETIINTTDASRGRTGPA